MVEEKVLFESDDVTLEGLLCRGQSDAGVVITHPHPQYGGSMQNNVVDVLVSAYQKAGFTTLRFNFRGVGGSGGQYDDGAGEQTDVQSAVAYIEKLALESIHLAGYSFGAWVNAQAVHDIQAVNDMVMVSPPLNFMDFSFDQYIPQLKLIIAGSGDDIAPPDMIQKMLPAWNKCASFHIINGADHFYRGKTSEIESIVTAFLKK